MKGVLSVTYAMITGATGVLGRAFAEEMMKRGYNLIITGRSAQKLELLHSELKELGNGDIKTFACDLTDAEQRKSMFAALSELKICMLINVAGADIQKPFGEYSQDKLTFQTRVNFEAAVSCCAFAIENRVETLRIINISSVSGVFPMPDFAIYSATKGALTSFSKAIAAEYRGKGVYVTAVLPGSIYTRTDVIQYINSLGAWAKFAAKLPQFVVKKSLAASERGKSCVVIGGANRLTLFTARLIPERLRLRFIARKWSATRKDAF